MMKLSKLLLMAMMVGSVAVLGCGDDETATGGTGGGTGGTGGGGGGAADPCTGGFCDDETADNKSLCDSAVEACDESPDYTEAECNEVPGIICAADLSDGGGTGGNCDYGDCVDGSAEKEACEASVLVCTETPFLPTEVREACIEAANLDQCGDPDPV